MRILHIIGTLNPESGGPAESVRALLKYAPSSYTGEVVTLDDPSTHYLSDIDFPVHLLGPTNTTYGFNTRLIPWLKDNRHRFDGVIVHGLWQYCGYAARRTLAGNTPYLVFPHGMLDTYFKRASPLKHIKKWLYWNLAEYWVLQSADRVLFTSKSEEQRAETTFWPRRWKAVVVPFGATSPSGDTELQLQVFFAKCSEAKGKRYLLFLGRIHRKKGCDLLIDAFVKVSADDPDLHLVMAGPDQQKWSAELQVTAAAAGIGHRVRFLPFCRPSHRAAETRRSPISMGVLVAMACRTGSHQIAPNSGTNRHQNRHQSYAHFPQSGPSDFRSDRGDLETKTDTRTQRISALSATPNRHQDFVISLSNLYEADIQPAPTLFLDFYPTFAALKRTFAVLENKTVRLVWMVSYRAFWGPH